MTTKILRRNVRRGLITRTALTIFSAMLLLLPACVEELTPPNNDNETTITFSVNVPKGFTPSTYALSGEDEEAINTVDVLLFDKDGEQNFLFGPHYGILNGSEVTIRIPSAAENYNMAVFANCRAELNQVFSTSSTKAEVLASLSKTVDEGNADGGLIGGTDAGWLTGEGHKTIPMYGEYKSGEAVKLVRMLARINVTIGAEGQPVVPFTLSEVYLCNYNNKGQIATASDWNEDTPTAIVSSAKHGFDKSIKYTATDNDKLEREIYTFEANAGILDNANNPCIIIGGEYNSSGITTYYRIDFVDDEGDYFYLLRNHSYNVSITKISDMGHSRPEYAFDSRAVNVEYEITPWDYSKVVNVVSDGQYALGVSQNSFIFDKSERTASSADNSITVTTNFPTAWTVSVPTQSHANWLTAAKQADNNTILLTCGINNENTSRTATVRITAGRMVQDISVTQIKDAVTISFGGDVSNDELYFESKVDEVPAEKSFTLSWTPTTPTAIKPTYTSNFSSSFGTVDGSALSENGVVSKSSGNAFTIAPIAITTNQYNSGITERTSVITYQLSYGGVTGNKILKIRHKVNRLPLPVTINAAPYYPRTNIKEKFFITSTSGNVAWIVKNVQLLSGTGFSMSNIDTTSGTATVTTSSSAGNVVEFTPNNSPTNNVKARVTIGSPTGAYTDISVDLNIGGERIINTSPSQVVWAGSNIYFDPSLGTNGTLTFDDSDSNTSVTTNERKQGVFFQWGGLQGFSPYGIPFSNIEVYHHTGGKATSSSWSTTDPMGAGTITDNTSRAYLYEYTDNTRGDICKRLTDLGYAPGSTTGTRWRMPTAAEFGTISTGIYIKPTNFNGFSEQTVPNSTDGKGGKFTINSGRTNNNHPSQPFFPAAGIRYYSSGQSFNIGPYGSYWASSTSDSDAYNLSFDTSTVSLSSIVRTYGSAVRCVQEN